MLKIRKSNDRGRGRMDWLDSHHSFSFADYYDPDHMNFRALRVINEDRIIPGAGFPPHGHRDMEILSYVIEGAIEHKDSIGNGSIIRRGDIQRMSAGNGVRHSEFNASKTEPVHFLQIWIIPGMQVPAGYEQQTIPFASRPNELVLLAAPPGGKGAVTVHQDVRLYAARLNAGLSIEAAIAPTRGAWIQVVRGQIDLGGATLEAGDGASTEDTGTLKITAREDAEFLLFDLA